MGKITKGSEGKRCSIDRPNRKTEIQNFRHRNGKGGMRKPENETQKRGTGKIPQGRKESTKNDEKKTTRQETNAKKKGHETNNEDEKRTGTKKTDNAEPNSSQV
ncbi:unnamed protein product [Polarella glacialis]|uniref:Uncharacterized protein n=1 Tax=Polarella glacialis TaxID=89957 RepID=A0A813HXU2_POLGL|nr:unnamed protein product [Polarella glacialis]